MIESLNKWSLESSAYTRIRMWWCNTHQFPTILSKFVKKGLITNIAILCQCNIILPFLHKVMLWRAVYDFSKVEKKIVANQQNSCKGSQCNRVDPITNPLNSGVTL